MKRKIILMICLFAAAAFAQVRLGPFVGAVDETSAVFVVKTYRPQKVKIELFPENEPATVLFTNSIVSDSLYNYVKIEANSLLPDTRYFYRAVVNDIASKRWHRFQTFPVNLSTNFSFGFGSCQQSGYSKWNPEVFPVIAQDTLRFFIQIGDWTYPDTTEKKYGYRFNSKMELVEKSYQSKYNYNYPFASEVISQMPIAYVYDDHDFAADNPDGLDANKEITLSAYKMFFPHYKLENPDNGIWQEFNFGDVDFFMLDLRSQRNENKIAFEKNGNINPLTGHSILAGFNIGGKSQKEWLLEELKNSTAKWKVIVSSVIFNPAYGKAATNKTITDKYPWIGNDVIDKWAGFPEDVNAVVQTVKENDIKNIIIISGDTHSCYIDDGTNSIFPEISASTLDVNNTHLQQKLSEGGLNIWNCGSYEGELHTYGRVSFVNKADNSYARLELVDAEGKVVLSYKLYSQD